MNNQFINGEHGSECGPLSLLDHFLFISTERYVEEFITVINCRSVEAIKQEEKNPRKRKILVSNLVTFSSPVHYIYTFITAIKSVRSKPQCGAECCVTFMMIMVGAGEDATDRDNGGVQNSAMSQPVT